MLVVTAIAATSVAVAAPAAWAHDCFNASANAHGTTGMAGSQSWTTVTLADIFADPVANPGNYGLPTADASAIPDMAADAIAAGSPAYFVTNIHAVAGGGKGVPESLLGNGLGIDHIDTYTPIFVAAYCANASGDPTGTICEGI